MIDCIGRAFCSGGAVLRGITKYVPHQYMAVVAVVALLNSVHILQKGLSISYVVSQINFLAYLALDPLK